jgi:chromosome segregation ATPase
MAAEWKGSTTAEYLAFKAAQRAEQIESILAPVRERRTALDSLQAHIQSELTRLRALPDQSDAITAQIAELEHQWDANRNRIEAPLNAEELIVNKAVASINSKPLAG